MVKKVEDKLLYYQCNARYCGIILGSAGVILSLAGLYHTNRDIRFLDKLYRILDEEAENNRHNFSLGYGVAGLAWSISLLDDKLLENKHEWLQKNHTI